MDIWDVAWLAPRPAEESEDVDLRLAQGWLTVSAVPGGNGQDAPSPECAS
jgi:hypothetical protein